MATSPKKAKNPQPRCSHGTILTIFGEAPPLQPRTALVCYLAFLDGSKKGQEGRKNTTLTREAFCQVAPRPLRGPRTSNFDKILTWGCVRSPNRSEPSRSCVASANTALREARRTPRFGHIWQVVAGANSGERGGRHAFYRHTESAISVFRPPGAQLTLKSTFTQD